MGLLKTVRQALRDVSPAWLNIRVDRAVFQNLKQALQPPPPEKVAVDPSLQGRPHWRRIAQVYAALDHYWANQGAATYDTLIQYVQEVTGQSCSRKLIAKWKQQRGLR
ncbi:MAG: hypothetical protein HC940_00925 [Acaryochloris sp. SU_5_25]|nr:hypothetical protein [Acaryochloris sp. SU_5_25]